MGRVTSLFARKVAAEAGGGREAGPLLATLGLELAGPVDPTFMIPAPDYYAFFERAAGVDPDPTTLPLRVGATMRSDDYGPFGFAWKSAPTLHGSYQRAARFALVLTSVAGYEVERCLGGAFMHLHRDGERRLGMRLSNEATLASIMTISREVASERFRPEEVHLRHDPPEDVSGHEAYFGCPVYFDSDMDAFRVSDATLRTPNRVGDASIARYFDTILEAEVGALDDSVPLHRRVLDRVSTALSGGVPTLSEVAREVGMSGRTLQRRLADEATSYQSLVDEARRKLAARLLSENGDATLSEVAFMTGFADQSAFTRAFKRWTGHTPGSFRTQALGRGTEG